MTTGQVSDGFLRFARAHLLTAAERAVYRILASDGAREWSVAEVASAAAVSHHEADQALRRFAAAGIVTHTHPSGGPHRYRWGTGMAYLQSAADAGALIDPVCGMPVPADAPHVAGDGGTKVRFCSLPCLVRWRSSRAHQQRNA